MEEQHTPGPWHLLADGFIYAKDGGRVADPSPWSPAHRARTDGTVKANARLIEAAPELLDALIDLLLDTQHSEHNCPDEHCPVARAKLAISQATGEPLPHNTQVKPSGEATSA